MHFPGDSPRLRRTSVLACYAAQGLGYAAVMTALPTFQRQWDISDQGVSIILLGTCVMAGLGSLFADLIAVRRGSRTAVCVALMVQVAAICTVTFAPSFTVFITAVVIYGVGLGTMDASENMQGTLLEAESGRPLLGLLYAGYTAASGFGALAMSGFLSASGAASGALMVAAMVQAAVAVLAAYGLDPTREARTPEASPGDRNGAAAMPRLPRGSIWAVGLVLLAAYMLDSAVSTWSTVYLTDSFDGAAGLAPLGYALYQSTTLISRLASDAIKRRTSSARLGVSATAVGVLGCVLVASVPSFGGAIAGFAIAGIAGGILIPLTFSAAGHILPDRRDEIIARVNLFNYAGVVLGAVAIGAVAAGSTIGVAFLIPGVGMLAVLPLAKRLGHRRPATPAAVGA
ncbi:MFS transporter [Gordonia oryzae]|uniref:MFS transporter n=1 Tax=Gordonia oryzae TaxID=2487349 RepID=A0A3N4G862_9ACTN|nr:MFS transporter [Gordonia oryzae]RPA58515.1 MFS transporter [Gordonia oryzae]